MGIFSSVVERDGFISLALCSRNKKARPGRSGPRTRSRPRILHFSSLRFLFHSVSALGTISFGYDWAGLGARNFSQQGGAYKRVKVFDRGVLSTE